MVSLSVKYDIFKAGFSMKDTCLKETFVISDTSQTAGIPPLLRVWSLGDETTSSVKTVSQKYANAGTYNVKLVIRQNGECADSLEKPLTVYKQVSPTFTVQNLCFKDSAVLRASHLPLSETVDDSMFFSAVKVAETLLKKVANSDVISTFSKSDVATIFSKKLINLCK